MYVLKYARGRQVYLTPLGQGLVPAPQPQGPAAEGTVVDAGDGILVRLDQVPEGFPSTGWFRADLYVLHGGYRVVGWGRPGPPGHLHFTPRGRPEMLFQRSSARVPLEVPLRYGPAAAVDDAAGAAPGSPAHEGAAHGGLAHEGVTQDISMDGVGLLGNVAAAEGDRLRIRFTGAPLDQLGTVQAQVRTVTAAGGGRWEWLLGCRFEDLDDDRRSVLRQVILEHTRRLTRPGQTG
ncbi:MAG: PilZ domain-containing protein [Thermaerobacter sp.]|nr:hypothetical protein [Bacillota bacterium]REJ38233.1 MAG: hypothetical protein DIU84_01020 [Bacillota bacterium]